jgi:hypothetical protein
MGAVGGSHDRLETLAAQKEIKKMKDEEAANRSL